MSHRKNQLNIDKHIPRQRQTNKRRTQQLSRNISIEISREEKDKREAFFLTFKMITITKIFFPLSYLGQGQDLGSLLSFSSSNALLTHKRQRYLRPEWVSKGTRCSSRDFIQESQPRIAEAASCPPKTTAQPRVGAHSHFNFMSSQLWFNRPNSANSKQIHPWPRSRTTLRLSS